MHNYWAYSSGFFNTTWDEVEKLPKAWKDTPEKFKMNIERIVKHFKERNGYDIVDFTVRKLPEKRNNWDNARLLVLKKSDGTLIAKRHNNSQFLSLEF